jgi:CheY-like chemotaxis protein/signal transduction histidine kinase
MAIRSVFGNKETRDKKSLANKDYYKTLIENKREAAFLADIEGDLFLLNKKAQLMTGYSEDEIREYHVRDLFVTVKDHENPFDARQFSEFTSRIYLVDARRYLIPVLIDFKEIEGRKFLGVCVMIEESDIATAASETKNLSHHETITIDPPAYKGDIQSNLTIDFEHQVRNILNNILGFSTLLAREPNVLMDKKLLVHVESIMKSGNLMKTLLNKISIGGADSYEVTRTSCPLAPIIQKAQILLDPVARQHGMQIQIRQAEEISVFTDEFLLLELLKFLLTKALQYTRTENVLVEISFEATREKAAIVIDNIGQDIPQAVINFIKRENTKSLYDINNPVLLQNPEIKSLLNSLNLIDGKISFSSGERMAEIAKVILPVAPGNDQPDDLSLIEKYIRERALNILIVEDDKFNASLLNLYFENICAVSTAFSGNEALNITEILYNQGVIFNVVIMDIGLPKPWDGILLKSEIEKRWPEYQKVPFLAQTAYTAKSFTDRLTENNFHGYLVKPINRSDLFRFVHRFTK